MRFLRRPGGNRGSFIYDGNIQDSMLRYVGEIRTEPRPYASPQDSWG